MSASAGGGTARGVSETESARPAASARRGRLRLSPIDRLIAVAVLIGTAILGGVLVEWSHIGWRFPALTVAAVFALAVGGECAAIPVAIGARRFRSAWGETSLLVALAVLPLPLVVLVKTASILVDECRRRRGPRRILFNTFGFAMTLSPGVAFFAFITRQLHLEVGTPASWPWLAVSGLIAALLNAGWVSAAISATSGSSWASVVGDSLVSNLAEYTANLVAALAIIGGWRYSRASLLALPFLLLVVWQFHNRQLNRTTERDALRRLAAASAAMPALSLVDMTDEVRTRAADLFGARGVQLRLGSTEDGAAPSEPAPTLTPSGVEVALIGRDGHLGYLALDVAQSGRLTRQESDVLVTFANTTAAALETVLAHAAKLHAAQHDVLTGLPNRALLTERAEHILEGAAAAGTRCAMILLDLNGFKNVNDTLGHAAGDRLLVEIGRRLADSVRSADCVARLGGDEFVVILDQLDHDVDADRLANTLVDRVSVPVTIDGLRLAVEASAGVALFPDDGTSVEALLRCADVAMYGAKRRGDSVVRYEPSQDLASPERLGLLADLQSALDADDQLHLHFQPQLDLRTGLTGNVEALVRWTHPTRGPLSPADFVPIIEHSALIGAFTAKVMDEAVRCCVEWQSDAALHGVGVAVNLSARNLMHRDLPDEVARVLARHGLPARKLVLEITETAAMNDAEICESVLARLRDLGVRLSVDDFGTGFASLTFLRRIDVAEVKLDRAFVADMLVDEAAATIVGATVALAHGLGLTVVAEGVETSEQLAALKLAGCDLAQGYFLSRPVPMALLADGAESTVQKGGIVGQISTTRHQAALPPPRGPILDGRELRAGEKDRA